MTGDRDHGTGWIRTAVHWIPTSLFIQTALGSLMSGQVSGAAHYATCGDSDAAFAWLEKAFARRTPGLLHVPVDPFFDPIRADPRIEDLCRRVGLPLEAWRGAAVSLAPAVEPG